MWLLQNSRLASLSDFFSQKKKLLRRYWEQMSGPDLHVFTLKFLAIKKIRFLMFWGSKKKFCKKAIMHLFSADSTLFSKTWKNRPQKLLIINPNPFISQSSPGNTAHSPELIFHIMKSRARHLFSYLWKLLRRLTSEFAFGNVVRYFKFATWAPSNEVLQWALLVKQILTLGWLDSLEFKNLFYCL